MQDSLEPVPTDSQIAIAALPVGIDKSDVYLLQPLVALAPSAEALRLLGRSRAETGQGQSEFLNVPIESH